MKLNSLEQVFFDRLLNAELDAPVPATLRFGNHTFKVIIVPEINSDGYFILKYFNALAYEPEPETTEGGVPAVSLSPDEACGQHPAFREAWLKSEPVTVQLHPTKSLLDRIPSQSKVHPELDARVQFADAGHRGRLRLEDNQVTAQESKLNRVEFCIVGFPDYVNPKGLLNTTENEEWFENLKSMAGQLNEGATINVKLPPPCITLDTKDGWKVTLTKDENLTRDHISHTGAIERIDGASRDASEITGLLEGLKAFFGIVAGKWCHPTAVIGYSGDQPAWGRIGRFDIVRQPLPTWFKNTLSETNGSVLEVLFPRFWCRWRQNKDEIAAIVECYVHSNTMQRAGLSEDAVVKSYAGLEMLASLMLGKTVYGDSHKEIGKVLDKQMPHFYLVNSKTPNLVRLYSDLKIEEDFKWELLGNQPAQRCSELCCTSARQRYARINKGGST